MDSHKDPFLIDPTHTSPANDVQHLENDEVQRDEQQGDECNAEEEEEEWRTLDEKDEEGTEREPCRLMNGSADLKQVEKEDHKDTEKEEIGEERQTPDEKEGEGTEWEQQRLINGDADLKEVKKEDHKDSEEEEEIKEVDGSPWQKFLRSMKPNPKLIRIKFIILLFIGGMAAFLPFLTLHMKQLGLTVREIAAIYAIVPIASIIGPPISGLLADTFGRYILVLVLNLALTVVLHTALLFVPTAARNGLDLECHSGGYSLKWRACSECRSADIGTSNLVLKGCQFSCPDPPSSDLTFCLSDGISRKCTQDSFGQRVELAVSLNTSLINDTCSTTMSNIVFEGLNYTDLSCPAVDCPIECYIEGAPECGWGGGGVEPPEYAVTFWVYFILRLAASLVLASSFTMVDATTLALVKEHKGDFGKQRVFMLVGHAVTPFAAGVLADVWSQYKGDVDYMPVIVVGDILLVLSLIMLRGVNPEVDTPESSVLDDLKKLVTKVEIDLFLIFILILGSNWGFIESYLFVFLIELKAPNFMLGLTMTVGCIVSLPMMVFADSLVNLLGRQNIFIVSFFTYAVRMFGYASISDPWLCLPFEALEVICYQLMWVAAVTYCPVLAPKGLLATMIGLAGSVHYSVGRGVGAFMGGYLIANYGMVGAFQIFGVISIVGGILNILVYKIFLKKKLAEKEKKLLEEEEEEKVSDMEGTRLMIEMHESEMVEKV